MLWADVAGIRGDTEVGSGAESNFGDLGMEGRGATDDRLDIVQLFRKTLSSTSFFFA